MPDPLRPPPPNPMMATAASALRAQQARMRVIAENIANAESTGQTAGSDPYRRQQPVFEPQRLGRGGPMGVAMAETRADRRPFRMEHDPGHPAANAEGYVKRSNVDPLMEALDLREAQRAYEANLNVIETARGLDSRTLDILKR